MKKIRYTDRNPEPLLPPHQRSKTFREYALGFSVSLALDEAQRCLFCRDAHQRCIKACPIGVDIPGFIRKITEGDLIGAYRVITLSNPFPSVCGRVCPQEKQCEGACILYYDTVKGRRNKGLPVSIGALEKFVGDFVRISGVEVSEERANPTGKRVAVVGAGPAGLACAYQLAKLGHHVDVYEALPTAGGVMAYGIPAARLPREVLSWEMGKLEKLGVRFFFGYVIGRTLSLRELLSSYHAVFLGVGAGRGSLGIKGDHLKGVYSAIEVLMRVGLMGAHMFPQVPTPVKLGRKTVVVGGGFTAVDCAITALRLGVETHVVYRRTRETSSARDEEWDHIQEEGAVIHWLTQPVEILGDEEGKVIGIKCVKMTLGEPDETGRPRPVPVPDSEHVIECDSVILAIGQKANPVAYEDMKELALTQWGTVKVDDQFRTNIPGLFAGGDVVNGGDTVVRALAHGRKAALSIHQYLMEEVTP
ncbi:glutamate synthase (NADPH), homotetrameric [Thermocrinis albus DSM 14484]|uniref:Glutamate synthase (NADPH), homotetrameric n=1 Tax=Thermocrinis albus (strain DSM 14484 / JCM 11386 / HI 11/12) TaxID=638303 RepID=D3SLS8_THEAH|nr:NADPH-dependent glutamate synthase [Thermocrinis albus]ADC89708.1 glutamate synthase (NADPH), homotetrameric [Thermocrinis albus DSM 14484]